MDHQCIVVSNSSFELTYPDQLIYLTYQPVSFSVTSLCAKCNPTDYNALCFQSYTELEKWEYTVMFDLSRILQLDCGFSCKFEYFRKELKRKFVFHL